MLLILLAGRTRRRKTSRKFDPPFNKKASKTGGPNGGSAGASAPLEAVGAGLAGRGPNALNNHANSVEDVSLDGSTKLMSYPNPYRYVYFIYHDIVILCAICAEELYRSYLFVTLSNTTLQFLSFKLTLTHFNTM